MERDDVTPAPRRWQSRVALFLCIPASVALAGLWCLERDYLEVGLLGVTKEDTPDAFFAFLIGKLAIAFWLGRYLFDALLHSVQTVTKWWGSS